MFLSVGLLSTTELGGFIKSRNCCNNSAVTVVAFEHALKIR